MPETTIIIAYLIDIIFLVTNITLLHIFLTRKRALWIQVIIFAASGVAVHCLRIFLEPFIANFLLRGFITGPLYLIPCALLFKESIQAKFFVFFLIYTVTQCFYLIFIHLDRFLSPSIPDILVFLGILFEFTLIPIMNKYLVPHVKEIIVIINKQNTSFTLFPIFSFLLLAFYGVQGIYLLSTFIPIVLSTIMIFFTYYLIAISIEQTKHQQMLDLAARTDSLTGLYNRRHIEQAIQAEYKKYQRTGREFALAMGDIDFFKKVNDTYGHDVGDRLLRFVSEELRKAVRAYDIVARWGGEEFLMLLPATNGQNAQELAERIRTALEESRCFSGREILAVTMTFGVSVVSSNDDTIQSVIKRADKALYHGKKIGRNCVVSFNNIVELETL